MKPSFLTLLFFSVLALSSSADTLLSSLEQIRTGHNLPGLSAMVCQDGSVVAQLALGVRRAGDPTPLRLANPICLGSCTKWMTATLAGRLVDRGLIRWETTVAECFPNAASFPEPFRQATLDQLLAHRAGIQEAATFEKKHVPRLQEGIGTIRELRRRSAEAVLRDSPSETPGAYLYSNPGYTVAAAMMELRAGKDWETLMQEEIFTPLSMNGATFGPQFDSETPPRLPVGHGLPDGAFRPQPRGPITGNLRLHLQASHGPATFVTCNLGDWLRFLRMHTFSPPASSPSATPYLAPATAARLRQAFKGDTGYGRGIKVAERDWAAPGPALTHTGDVFGQDTLLWMAPAKDFIVIVFTNCRTEDSRTTDALQEAAQLLITRFAGK